MEGGCELVSRRLRPFTVPLGLGFLWHEAVSDVSAVAIGQTESHRDHIGRAQAWGPTGIADGAGAESECGDPDCDTETWKTSVLWLLKT